MELHGKITGDMKTLSTILLFLFCLQSFGQTGEVGTVQTFQNIDSIIILNAGSDDMGISYYDSIAKLETINYGINSINYANPKIKRRTHYKTHDLGVIKYRIGDSAVQKKPHKGIRIGFNNCDATNANIKLLPPLFYEQADSVIKAELRYDSQDDSSGFTTPMGIVPYYTDTGFRVRREVFCQNADTLKCIHNMSCREIFINNASSPIDTVLHKTKKGKWYRPIGL